MENLRLLASTVFILMLSLLSIPTHAATQIFTTPYFSIPLMKSMQEIASDDGKVDNYLQHMYVYGESDNNIDSSITINVIPLTKTNNTNTKQQDLITAMVQDLQDKGSPASSKFDPKGKIQTVKLKDKEFKSYTLNFQEGIMKIFTTTDSKNIYSFVIACYGKNINQLNERVKLLTDEISEVQLK